MTESLKQTILTTLRRLIQLIPRSKLINFLACAYMEKYINANNTNMYTNGEYRFLKSIIEDKTNPTVFDVGANVGNWTQTALDINTTIEIHAFEPFLDTYTKLLERDFPKNIHRNHLGLGAEKIDKKLYIYEKASTHNTMYLRYDKPYDKAVTIQIDTIDNYCLENDIEQIDYLKIDVEGNDFDVLRGAEKHFQMGRIQAVQFEYGNNYIEARRFLKDIFDFIKQYDYNLYKIMPNGLKNLETYHPHYENFLYSNYAIIKKS